MPSDNDKAAHPLPAAARERLARIADLLGYTVEDFMEGSEALQDQKGASELLKLWNEIGNSVDRGRLLAFARELTKA